MDSNILCELWIMNNFRKNIGCVWKDKTSGEQLTQLKLVGYLIGKYSVWCILVLTGVKGDSFQKFDQRTWVISSSGNRQVFASLRVVGNWIWSRKAIRDDDICNNYRISTDFFFYLLLGVNKLCRLTRTVQFSLQLSLFLFYLFLFFLSPMNHCLYFI